MTDNVLNNIFEYYKDNTNRDSQVKDYLANTVYYDLNLDDPSQLNTAFARVLVMAKAYAYGDRYYLDEYLMISICNNLGYLSGYYNKKVKQTGNWWYWRIGIPNNLLKTLVILEYYNIKEKYSKKDVYKDSLNKFLVPHTRGDMTYANLASICRNVYVMGIVYNDDKLIKKGLNDVTPAFAKVNTCKAKIANDVQKFLIRNKWLPAKAWMTAGKEGLYDDGTFLQHTSIAYIGTYGLEIIEYAALICSVCPDALSILDKSIIDNLPLWIKAYHLAIYDNQVLLVYCGRAIETVNTVASANQINKYIAEVENVIGKSEFNEDEEFVCVQENGGVAIYNTPEWRFVVKMASDKVARYEYFLGQNKNGFNQGNGMTYLYIKGDRQYIDHSIAELDYHRLPGTTADVSKETSETTSEQPRFDYTKEDLDEMSCGLNEIICGSSGIQVLGTNIRMHNKLGNKYWYFFTLSKIISCYGDVNTCGDSIETIVDSRCGKFNISYKTNNEWINVENGITSLSKSEVCIDGVGIFDIENDFYIEKTDSRYIIGIKHDDVNRLEYSYDIYPTLTKEEFDEKINIQ